MKFIVRKDSETGKKLLKLKDKIDDCNEKALDLVKELGAKNGTRDGFFAAGGISSLEFTNAPNPKIWKKVGNGQYMPKRNIKKGISIYNKIKSLPKVEATEINEIIGYTNIGPWNHPGLNCHQHVYYIGVFGLDKWGFPKNNDLQEVTVTEFNEMFKEETKEA